MSGSLYSKEENILEKVLKTAEEYLPEWRPLQSESDAGTAIASLFAEQMEELKRYTEDIQERCHGELITMLGLPPLPPSPAHTILAFETDRMAEQGVEIPKGARFAADIGGEAPVVFETEHDIAASTADLSELFTVSAKERKVISQIENLREGQARLFDTSGENVYLEEIGIEHPLLPKGRFLFQGLHKYMEKNRERQSVFTLAGAHVRAFGWAAPELVCSGELETDIEQAELFGQEILPYKECYIGHDQVFAKAGAQITCSFELEWRIKDYAEKEPQAELKPVVRRRKDRAAKRYEVFPEQVDITYFNGKGYRQLPLEGEDIFSDIVRKGEKKRYIWRFRCPNDWAPQMVAGRELRCIRLCIVRARHAYMPEGIHHYPVMSKPRFFYSYGREGIRPQRVYRRAGGRVMPVAYGETLSGDFPWQGESVFFGFDRAFPPGQAGLYLTVDTPGNSRARKLKFFYSSEEGMKSLEMNGNMAEDSTDGLKRSGLISFTVPGDAAVSEIAGKKCFWLGLTDEKPGEACFPVLSDVAVNAVKAVNLTASGWKEYTREQVRPKMRVKIPGRHIVSAEVWVEESALLTKEEIHALEKKHPGRVQTEREDNGQITRCHVLWEECAAFETLPQTRVTDTDARGRGGRYYVLDRESGELCFGDGKHAALPGNMAGASWKLRTLCCDGERGNIKAGTRLEPTGEVRHIKRVYSPVGGCGGTGCAAEGRRLEQGKNRMCTAGHMVTEQDIRRMAEEFSPEVAEAAVRCDDKGSLAVAVRTASGQEVSELTESLGACLSGILPEAGVFHKAEVRGILPVTVSVSVWVTVLPGSEIRVREELRSALARYFSEQQKRTRRIGRLPKIRELGELLRSTSDRIRMLRFCVYLSYNDGNGYREQELTEGTRLWDAVCSEGEHTITVASADGRGEGQ